MLKEIEFMLGSIEECNSEPLLSILKKHGIDPDGGWLDIKDVPDEVIQDIMNRLFKKGEDNDQNQ